MSDSFLPTREFLRHTLATVAYRGGKTLKDAPASFAGFKSADSSRTPVEIVAHMGDLYEWSLSVARGAEKWHNSRPLEWDREVQRFFATLKNFDDYLASEETLRAPIEKLFQGPIADSLTHIGQLAMLRRLAGCPIKGENYLVAEIAAGRLGTDQAAPRREF
jgi:hypothetical protein